FRLETVGIHPAKLPKMIWNVCARLLSLRRNVACALALMKSNCTWPMAILRTALCRQFQTNVRISTVAPLKIACVFHYQLHARCVPWFRKQFRWVRASREATGGKAVSLLMMRLALPKPCKERGSTFFASHQAEWLVTSAIPPSLGTTFPSQLA